MTDDPTVKSGSPITAFLFLGGGSSRLLPDSVALSSRVGLPLGLVARLGPVYKVSSLPITGGGDTRSNIETWFGGKDEARRVFSFSEIQKRGKDPLPIITHRRRIFISAHGFGLRAYGWNVLLQDVLHFVILDNHRG